MKTKALITVVLLATSNFVWAQGGLGIDNIPQHTGTDNTSVNNTHLENTVQKSTNKDQVVTPEHKQPLVDIHYDSSGYEELDLLS